MKNNNTNVPKYKPFSENMLNKILKHILSNLKNPEFLKKFTHIKTHFSRNRKLNIMVIAQMIFVGINISLSMFLTKFQNNMTNSLFEKYNTTSTDAYTKQAFSKARNKLSFRLYKELNDSFVNERYSLTKSAKRTIKLYKNKYLPIAVDGSATEVPNTKENMEIYGHTTSQEGAKQVARAGVSSLFDVINKVTIMADIREYPLDERGILKEQANRLEEIGVFKNYELLLIHDRGYFSDDMVAFYLEKNINFLFRLKSDSLKSYVENIKSNDEYIYIPTKRFLKKVKDERVLEWLESQRETIKLRITKIILCTGEIEVLLSNLDMKIISYDDINELYNSRWGIEINYDFLKNILEVENFSGKTTTAIEQDFYARILCSNIEYAVKELSDREIAIEQSNEELKHKYQTNKNILNGIFSESIFDLFKASDSFISKIIKYIIDTVSKYRVEISDGTEHNPRYKAKKAANKYKLNSRRAS